jgi:plastocyanin
MRRLLITLASAIVLVAAGCGGGSSGSSSSSSTSASSAPASSSPAPSSSGSVVKVVMKNIQYSPKTITVKKGTTVEWTNDDSLNHDVTKASGPGPAFTSGTGNIGSGGTYKQTFNVAGTIQYHCTVHPGMTGTIVVK